MKKGKLLPQIRRLRGKVLCCIVFSDGSKAVTIATLERIASVDYIKQGFSAVSRSGILEPDLNNSRREVEFAAQSVDLVAFGTRLLGEISLQNLVRFDGT